MDYYRLLQLEREPFSNSPDPDYYFQSRQHTDCLHRLELALRLKRGLNVVIGEVGTGKTTLCRELIRRFADQPDIETHLILDPSFDSATELLTLLGQMLASRQTGHLPCAEIKEQIKQALFHKGIEQQRTVILIIDEGQKIPPACIEPLRELLNFETNTYKLLQIVIFAQPEFESILRSHVNFSDRINLLHHLQPMDFRDTRQMIMYRIRLASAGARPRHLFTWPALWSIYRASQGYPRRIIHLCHQSVLAMIIQNRSRAGWNLIRSCRKRLQPARKPSMVLLWTLAGLVGIALSVMVLQYKWKGSGADSALHFFKVPAPSNASDPSTIPADTGPTLTSPPVADPLPEDQKTLEGAHRFPDISPTLSQTETRTAALEPDNTEGISSAVTAPPKTPTALFTPPQILGTMVVRPGDTLASMVRRVYGAYRRSLITAVLKANPGIYDPDTIEIGDLLIFPAVRFTRAGLADSIAPWIVLHEGGNLLDALEFQSILESRLDLSSRLIAMWSPSAGLRFHVALKEPFVDPARAQARLKTLPDEAATAARVVDAWPGDAQFYSIVSLAESTDVQ